MHIRFKIFSAGLGLLPLGWAAALAIAPLLLTGCESYDVTLNDKLVYGPARLFRHFEIPDVALHDCVSQAIADQGVTQPQDLKTLNCSSAGIKDLEGLSVFPGIRQLKLSDNQIRNLVVLEQLAGLQALWLDNNAVVDPVPLARLTQLARVDLSGNPGLQCPKPGLLSGIAELTLPAHCAGQSSQ